MIDHVVLNVSDYAASKPFYDAALAPLGFALVMEFEGMCGWGATASRGCGSRSAVSRAAVRTWRSGRQPRADRRVPRGGARRRRPRQRAARAARALPPELLLGFRPGPGRRQHRGRHPHAGMTEYHVGRLLDHVHLQVRDLEASKRFYAAALGAVGRDSAASARAPSGPMSCTSPTTGRPRARSISPSRRRTARPSTASMRPLSPPGARTTAPRASGITTLATTRPTCSTRTATTSRPSTTGRPTALPCRSVITAR